MRGHRETFRQMAKPGQKSCHGVVCRDVPSRASLLLAFPENTSKGPRAGRLASTNDVASSLLARAIIFGTS